MNISETHEPLRIIDATPDANYPLRILCAYRESCNYHWGDSVEGSDTSDKHPVFVKLNAACVERAKVLDHAIAILEREL